MWQRCGNGAKRSGGHAAAGSFRSYRVRLRRRLTPILILVVCGITAVVGRSARVIAGGLLRDRTTALLSAVAATVERLEPEPERVEAFLSSLVRHPDREAFALARGGTIVAMAGSTADEERLLSEAAALDSTPGAPATRIFGFGPFVVRLVGAAPLTDGSLLVMEHRMHGLWTPFTAGFVLVVVVSVIVSVLAVTYLSNSIYRPVVERLATLEEGLVRYGAGDASVRLEPSSDVHDEFDEVFEAFNRMASRINELERERAERIEDERTLLANLAHDINTPITVLRGYTETLTERGGEMPAEKLAAIHAELLGQTLYVQAIVDDLLTLARERSAQLRVEPVRVDLDEIFDLVVDTFAPLAAQRGISVFGDAGGLTTHADPVRLRQILTNLVRNALLHAQGATTVELGARSAGGGVEIWVEDDGCGIDEERVQGLFSRYRRGEGTMAAGWGLGLFIVRTLAELHGGRVRYRPAGPGSRFEVFLPGSTSGDEERDVHGEGAGDRGR